MRFVPAAGKSHAHFFKVLSLRPETKIKNPARFPVFLKDAAEIAAIVFSCVVLCAALCAGTILFLERMISILKEMPFLRLISEM